jgi:hypothetical protein
MMMNKPDISKMDYKYGIFKRISRPYGGPTSMYWTNKQIKSWMDKNDVFYENTDKREDLVQRIKNAGFK